MSSAIEISFVLLLGATLTVALSQRLGLPNEVLLLVGSLVLSLIPGLPVIQLRSELVFLLLLPPILFAAAYFTSWRDFKANKRAISLLAVGLVLFTTVAVAGVLKLLIPDVPWPVGFMLGAMVSPPDASAATAITRKLGVPRRLVTIIEGESLVNDATALIAYRFAIAALATGSFSLGSAALRFIWVSIGGVVVGLAVASAAFWLLRRLEETSAQTLVSLLAGFGAYWFGEVCQVSGVIATVTAGLFFGRCLPLRMPAQTRISGRASWDLVLFVVNGFVFALIGLELPEVVHGLSGAHWPVLILQTVIVCVTVVAVRFLWIFPATYLPRWLVPSLARKDPAPPWQMVVALGWTGMRGIVSLAAALALPKTLPDGSPFIYRNLLIFITYGVILTSLLVPSLTLPWLLRRLNLKAGDENHREEVRARIRSVRAVLDGLDNAEQSADLAAAHVNQIRGRYQRRLQVLESNLTDQAFSPLADEDQQLRRLLRRVITWERDALNSLRQNGEMHDEVFHALATELDLEDLRLRTQRL